MSNYSFSTAGAPIAYANQRAPSPTDDTTLGYAAGNFWIYGGNTYIAQSVAAGQANWEIQTKKAKTILDAVSVGALAAYGAFKLKSAYAGNAFQIRRSSDSTTLNIGFAPDGTADWNSVDAFLVGTTGTVTTWYDQSGNGYDLTQATVASQPKIYNNYVGGLRSLSFHDSTGSAFMTNTAMALTSTQNVSVLCVNHAHSACGITGCYWYDLGTPTPHYTHGASQGPSNSGMPIYCNSTNYPVATLPMSNDNVYLNVTTAGVASVNQNNKKTPSTGGTMPSLAATGLYLGGTTVVGYPNKLDMTAFVVFNSALSTTDQQSLLQATYQASGIVPQSDTNIVFVGDSITEGILSAGASPDTSFVMQALRAFNRPITFTNVGYSGQFLSVFATQTAAMIANTYQAGKNNIAVIFGGTNDISQGNPNATGAQVYATYQTIAGLYRAAGFKVVVVAMLPRNSLFTNGQTTAGFETARQALYTLLLAGWSSFADAFVDLVGDPIIGPSAVANSATYFQDAVHPTVPLGSSYVIAAIKRGIASLLT